MANLGGDGASMMGSFDPAAFTGRDEDLFLPGDSLFGFSAAAGIGDSPDVGGDGDGGASFQGGSASMLFPPSAASFQAMASLPPQPDSTAAVSAAGVLPSRQTSASRRDLGGASGRGGAGRAEGGTEGDDESTSPVVPVVPPPPLRKAPSLKQSLDAAIMSATARDSANEAAAAAKSSPAAETKKAAARPKSSARPRRRGSGGRGRGNGSSKAAKAGGGGSSIDVDSGAGTGAGGESSVGAARRPTRDLRRPRQESSKKSEQAAADDALGTTSRRRAAAANHRGGGAAPRAKSSATTTNSAAPAPATAAATAEAVAGAAGGRSASGTSPSARSQRGGSPCRPPPRRTSLEASLAEKGAGGGGGGGGKGGADIALPVGIELIPGFEDTIDSHFMTTLLQQKSPDAQPSDPVSAFASADGQGLEAADGESRDEFGGGGGGIDIDFGIDPDAPLDFAAGLLLGNDTQPGAASTTAGSAGAKQPQADPELAGQAASKAGADGVALDADDDAAVRSSTAHRENGVALSSPAPAGGRTEGTAPVAAAPPLPSPAAEPARLVSPTATAAVAAPPSIPCCPRAKLSRPPSAEVSALIGPTGAVSASSLDATGPPPPTTTTTTTTATRPPATECNRRTENPKRSTADPSRPTEGSQPEPKAERPPATRAPRATYLAAKPVAGQPQPQPRPRPLAAAPPSPAADDANDEVQVDVGTDAAAPAGPALALPPSFDTRTRTMRTTTTATTKRARRATPARGALQAPLLPRPPSLMIPLGALSTAPAPMATAGVGSGGGFSVPVAPAALAPTSSSRPLPRKVSLRFSPRDASTEDKLSKHGYLPFQKLTAPLWKPLEAVFKFMVKKWSEVAYSDLNNIRIVFDVAEADRLASPAQRPPPAHPATIVWSAEQSSRPLTDLVSSLPRSALERIRDEEALSLTYTFTTGPVGPPPSQGSAPWDTPQGGPATANDAPRPPPPLAEPRPAPQRGPPSAPPRTLRSPVVEASGGRALGGGGAAVRRPGGTAGGKSSAEPAVAEGRARRAPASSPEKPGDENKSAAVDGAAGGTGGSSTRGRVRRAATARASAVPVSADALASTALKKHYKNVAKMFKRQGVLSPAAAHFLPGGLFARMHSASAEGAAGALAGTGQGPATATATATAAAMAGFSPGTSSVETLHPAAAGKVEQEKCNSDPPDAEDQTAESFDGGVDAADGGGFEDFGGDANSEAEGGGGGCGGGDQVGDGALMGEETCMAFFGGNGVELLVDPSPPPTKMGEELRAGGGGGEKGVGVGVTEPVSSPGSGGVEASAAASRESVGGEAQSTADPRQPPPQQPSPTMPGTHGTAASPARPAAGRDDAEARMDSALPPTHPPPVESVAVEARPGELPASPPPAGCVSVGEETCMALFGGNGVELLLDTPPSQTGSGPAGGVAAAAAERQTQPESPPSSDRASVTAGVGAQSASTPSSPTGRVGVAAAGGRQAVEESGDVKEAGQQEPNSQPEESAAAAPAPAPAVAEAKQVTRPPSPSSLAVDDDRPCAGSKRAPRVVAQDASFSPAVAGVPKGASLGPADAGATAVSEAPKHESTVSPLERPDGEPGEGEAPTRIAATPPPAATPAVVGQAPPSSRSPPAFFKMGKLPTRAGFGRPPPRAVAAASAAAPSLAAEEEPLPTRSSAALSTFPAQALPRSPSGADHAAPSLPHRARLGAGEACLSTDGQRQSRLEPAAVASAAAAAAAAAATAATEGVLRASSQAVDKDAETEVTPPASGVVSEAAAAGCKDAGGGGGAVAVPSRPALPTVQNAANTTGAGAMAAVEAATAAAAVAAEDAAWSQMGGTRKLTRSHSNGGDPASFGSSGGGCSSQPEGERGRLSKKERRDGAPSTSGQTPPQTAEISETSGGAKRRRCGSRKDARGGLTRKRIAPTTQSSGGAPQRATSPVFDSPARDVNSAASADAAAPAESASRPYAFASSKGPPPSPVDGGGDAVAVMPADLEPKSAGVCPSAPPPAEVCGAAVGDGVKMSAVRDVDASPAVCAPAAPAPSGKARPFAFAAAARKGEWGELRRAGASVPTIAAVAVGQAATPLNQSDLPVSGAEASSPQPRSPSSKASGRAAEGLGSPHSPAPVRNSVSASLSLSMSPEEVQAGYSEAWSSLPNCFWDESAIVGAGAAGDGAEAERSTAEGPVTRWLALPHAGPTLGGTAPTAAAAPPRASSPAPAASRVVAPICEGYRGDRGNETGATATATAMAGSAVELTRPEVKQSRWASFCTAFAASRGSSGGATSGGSTAAAAAAASSTRATEEARSLPTLIRLGRSMTKGVAPVEKDSSEGEGTRSTAPATAPAPVAAAITAVTGEESQTARGVAEAAGAPASAPPRASLATGRPLGTSDVVPPAGAAGGGGRDTLASGGLSGTTRKRADSGGHSDDGAASGGDAGGGNEARAATALPKKRAKKKGRIAPVFVSSLPPDSFGTFAGLFSSNPRA